MIGDVIVRLGADISDYQRKLTAASGSLQKFGSGMQQTGAAVAKTMATMAAVSAAGVGYAVKAASDYESAFAGVRKTTDATEAEFAALSKGIRDMSKEIPLAAKDIASIAEVAGQLGIKKDDILDFTRVMADLGVATNMSAEEASVALARFANITGMSMDKISNLGSTVVGLGEHNCSVVEKSAA